MLEKKSFLSLCSSVGGSVWCLVASEFPFASLSRKMRFVSLPLPFPLSLPISVLLLLSFPLLILPVNLFVDGSIHVNPGRLVGDGLQDVETPLLLRGIVHSVRLKLSFLSLHF